MGLSRKCSKESGTKMVKVNLKLPTCWIKIFDENIKGAEYISISDYIRNLIRKDLRERGLLKQ